MKLRNKETGEIKEAEARDDGICLYSAETEQWFKYDLPLLAEYWEYYVEPKEPLIKDEKIRKAVRAWAEALDIKNSETVFLTKPEYHARVLDVEKGLFTMTIPYDEDNIEDVCNLPYTMSKNCRIEFVEGELMCLCNHRDYKNCDLYEEDDETYDGSWVGEK